MKIQNIKLANSVILAPMSGISDLPFRNIASRYGAGMVVSEMTASEQLVGGHPDMLRKVLKQEGNMQNKSGPFVVQLAGREAKWMARGAKYSVDAGADIIDINMGCPSKKVTKGAAGSALMKDLDLASSLIDAVVSEVTVPVTLKMRLGWDDQCLSAVELAKRAQVSGVSMITVHGRTRCQFYKGKADWSAIKPVKESVNVPVVVNGDITSSNQAHQALHLSGADGVMIGRAACGRPWLPGMIADELAGNKGEPPSMKEQLDILLEQLEASLLLYGKLVGVKMFRKHLAWSIETAFEKKMSEMEIANVRGHICRLQEPDSIRSSLSELYDGGRVKETLNAGV